MVELPSVNPSRRRFRAWVLDVTSAVLAFFVAAFGAVKLVRDPSASAWELAGTGSCVVGLLSVSVVRASRTRRDEARYEPLSEPKEVAGWAKGLHARLCTIRGCAKAGDLGVRITVHKVLWDRARTEPVWLEQTIGYVGGHGGPAGRRTSAHCGIGGRAARMADLYTGKRSSADPDAFRDELVEAWGYTRRQAYDRSIDRWAWMAVPLLQPDNQTAYGLVFLDAEDVDFFDDGRVRDAVVAATEIFAAQAAAIYNRPR